MMKNANKYTLMTLLVILSACQNSISNDDAEEIVSVATKQEKSLTFDISRFDSEIIDSAETITKSVSLSSGADYLTLVLFDENDEAAYSISQTATQAVAGSTTGETEDNPDFGIVSLSVQYGTYKLVVVANSEAVNAEGMSVISPTRAETSGGKVTDTFVYEGELTVDDSSSTSISVSLNRAVAFLIFKIDDKPDDVVRFVLAVTGGSNILDPSTGKAVNAGNVTQVSEFDLSTTNLLVAGVGVYTFLPDETGTVDVTATAYNSANEVVMQRTFNDVSMQINYKTYFEGHFFGSSNTISIALESIDWSGAYYIKK